MIIDPSEHPNATTYSFIVHTSVKLAFFKGLN